MSRDESARMLWKSLRRLGSRDTKSPMRNGCCAPRTAIDESVLDWQFLTALTVRTDRRRSDYSSVAISRHASRSVSDQRGARFALVALRAPAGSTRSPGRGWRSQPARSSLRQHEATQGNRQQATSADHCGATSESAAPERTTDGPVNSEARASSNGSSTSENSSQRPRQRTRARYQPRASNCLTSRHSADGASADTVTE